MRISKAIYLSFNNTNVATSQITVPFKVSSIHIKAIGFDAGNLPVAGNATYGIISSDLTDNQPLGVFYNDRDRKSTRLNSSHVSESRMPSSA